MCISEKLCFYYLSHEFNFTLLLFMSKLLSKLLEHGVCIDIYVKKHFFSRENTVFVDSF